MKDINKDINIKINKQSIYEDFPSTANRIYNSFLNLEKKKFIDERYSTSYMLAFFKELDAHILEKISNKHPNFKSLLFKCLSSMANFESESKKTLTQPFVQNFSLGLKSSYEEIRDTVILYNSFLPTENYITELEQLKFSIENLKNIRDELNNSINDVKKEKEDQFKILETNITEQTDSIEAKLEMLKSDLNHAEKNVKERLYNLNTSVNKEELAYYFKEEAKNLKCKYWISLLGTLIGMSMIFYHSKDIYTKIISNEKLVINHQMWMMTLLFFMILTWFTWFSSKQFSYIKQVRDEYEYKYALSKSYLSYRKEAEDLSGTDKKELLLLLLGSVINNIATSPVQSVKSDCHTPFSEVLSAAKEVIKQPKE